MTVCERCGAIIAADRTAQHAEWHDWLNDKLASRYAVLGDVPADDGS